MTRIIGEIRTLAIKFKRFITFGLVGAVNTLVDFIMFTLCHELIGLAPDESQAAGYLTGIICSFILNRTVTFRDWTRGFWQQMTLFILINGIGFFSSTYIINYMTSSGLNAYISKIAVTGLVMLINYFGYKLLVFKVKNEEGEANGNE